MSCRVQFSFRPLFGETLLSPTSHKLRWAPDKILNSAVNENGSIASSSRLFTPVHIATALAPETAQKENVSLPKIEPMSSSLTSQFTES
jgi:hypothetical protein